MGIPLHESRMHQIHFIACATKPSTELTMALKIRIIQSRVSSATLLISPQTATSGAGAQLRFGWLAVRAEYERFEIGSNTSLLSLGATWSLSRRCRMGY
jgi:hypothetical protein